MLAAIIVLSVVSSLLIISNLCIIYFGIKVLGHMSLEVSEVTRKHNMLVIRLSSPNPAAWGGATETRA